MIEPDDDDRLEGRGLRVLAFTLEPIGRNGERLTRNSLLFEALRGLVAELNVVRPELPRLTTAAHRLRHVSRSRGAWRSRAVLSERHFTLMTRRVQRAIHERAGSVDVVLQHQTLFSSALPGTEPVLPYVVYTDNFYAATLTHYPAWEPLRPAQSRRWLELEQDVCRRAAFVLTKSEFMRRVAVDDYGCDPARAVSVGSGANLVEAEPRSLPTIRPVALFVGNKFELKGGSTLLTAWEAVRASVPGAELWIVGPTPRASSPGVRWFGLVGEREELRRLYREASVFVMPSLFEAFGTVFLEAMGHSLPCIASDFGALPEVVVDGETGFTVSRGDAASLARALIRLLADPSLALALGVAGYRRVEERFTWQHVAGRMLPLLTRAARGNDRRGSAERTRPT